MKNLFRKLKEMLHNLAVKSGKKLSKINPDMLITAIIGGIIGAMLLWLTILNIIYFPFLITWLIFIIPMIALFISCIYLFIKPSKESVITFGITSGISIMATAIFSIVYGAFGVIMIYTIPQLIFVSCIYSIYQYAKV